MTTITKPTTAKEVFQILREFMEDELHVLREERRNVWDVLTALRGPDNAGLSAKFSTTGIIRREALGNAADSFGAIHCPDSDERAQWRREVQDDQSVGEGNPGWHFIDHAKNAFAALGLNWTSNNHKEG